MTDTSSFRGNPVLTRLTAAGLVILICGSAASFAAEPIGRPVTRARSVKPSVELAQRARLEATTPTLDRSQIRLRDPHMSVEQAIDVATRRALALHNGLRGGIGKAPIDDASNQGASGGGRVGSVSGSSGRSHQIPMGYQPGTWPDDPNFPGMGTGYANCFTSEYVYGDLGTRSFADMNGIGRWPIIPVPDDTPDLDGDGEPDDPIPNRPVIVYYRFLDEDMTDLEWDSGDDNFNLVGLRTQDTNGDGNIDSTDDPDDTDGLSDTWTEPFVDVSVIPPADQSLATDELGIALSAMGLGTVPWGNDRPVFIDGDAEAAWRLAQALYGGIPGFTFQDTFESGQVFEPEERQLMLRAMEAIESVSNVIFIERTGDFSGYLAGYPFAPKGYVLDQNGLLVNPGPYAGGPGGDVPYEPDDDYPWVLIAKGSDTFFTANANFTTQIGAKRETSTFIDNTTLIDINGDGFPDTPDLDGDFLPDQVILSDVSRSFGTPPPTTALDATGDGAVTAADTSFTYPPLGGPGTLDFADFFINRTVTDFNADGTPDVILDPNTDGDNNVVDVLFGLQFDFDGDNVGDSVFPGGTEASPTPYPMEAIPCELVNISQAVIDNESIGVMVHEMMHALGFNHEHQRPDREEYVHVNIEHIDPANVNQFVPLPGGTDQYANYIDNFDTTPNATAGWTVSGSPSAGAWVAATPVTPGSGDISPPEDYAVDSDDDSAVCFVTGNTAGEDLDGTTILTSPTIYGPKDAEVKFAYWFATDGTALDETDGLIVESSNDGGTTWDELVTITDSAQEWRTMSVTVGETRNDSDDRDPSFILRFTARDEGTDNQMEVGIDRVRVQNPYDFLSIMHYGTYGFSIFPNQPGFEVIEVRPPNDVEFQNQIGQRSGLSEGDRLALANLFGGPPTPVTGTDEPCRADVNEDGIINGADLLLFLEWYNSGDSRADFADEQGVIDVFDLLQFFIDFQNRFECANDGNGLGQNNLGGVNPD